MGCLKRGALPQNSGIATCGFLVENVRLFRETIERAMAVGRSARKRFWRIRGYHGYEIIFDQTLPLGSITDEQLKMLLRCLAAKANLTNEEIVGLYVKRKTKGAHEFMPVQSNGPSPGYYCGIDTVFIAGIVDDAGERVEFSGWGFWDHKHGGGEL